jgi:hypothetical protein
MEVGGPNYGEAHADGAGEHSGRGMAAACSFQTEGGLGVLQVAEDLA